MTNSGGGDASDPLRPVGPRARANPMQGASRAQGVQRADGPEASSSTAAVDPAGAAARASGTDGIAEALAAGTIDPATARAQLIDEAIAASLPPGSDPALVADLRAEIEAVLAADPTLERLLG